MAKIENYKYNISEAFRDCFYLVPDYQREYVWTEKQVEQLLEDIDEQLDSGNAREYFIGTVLVSPADPEQRTRFEVIDGQQRLTTLFLLLCALKHLFRGQPQVQALAGLISTSYVDTAGNTQTSLKLEPRYENAGAVISKIAYMDADPPAVRAGIRNSGIASFGSLERILAAYDTIYQYLTTNYAGQPELRKYWGFIANNVVFIQISTDLGNALKIFETINERGVGLNPMDLLKNLLFRQVHHHQFTQLKDEWKKITKPLEKGHEKPLRFLRYFLMANYEIRLKRGDKIDAVMREDEIYTWFTSKDSIAACQYTEKPFEFVHKIARNVDQYLMFAEGRGNDGKANIAMENLKRLCGAAFSLHYILLLAAANFPKTLFDHFVAQLESFLFYYIFTKTPTKELERNFSYWADELHLISEAKTEQEQRAKLNQFVTERFQQGMAAKERELVDALRRYTLDSMQQYRTRYLLAKLTQFVDMAYRGLKIPGSLAEYEGLEIEHILPDTPQQSLLSSWAESSPGAKYDDYKQKLGNLTLLEKPINIVASNDFFDLKLPEYLKCKYYVTSSISALTEVGKNTSISRVNELLRAFDKWDSKAIDARQELLIGLAHQVWRANLIPADSAASA